MVDWSKFSFFNYGHVVYQITCDHQCNNMLANILPGDPFLPPPQPRGWGQTVKIQLFQNIVMVHIKLNQICSNMKANILPTAAYPPFPFLPTDPYTPCNPEGGVMRSALNFFRTWSCCISN